MGAASMTDSFPNPLPPATFKRRALALGVHLFTATGAIWGLLSILAIQQGQYKLLLLWVALAIFVDGFDGILARHFHTKFYASEVDGGLLDNIIDYLNYTIVGVLLVIQARLAPDGLIFPAAALIALTSALQFSQTEAKTDLRSKEFYFKGFPSYWNLLALYLLVLNLNPWINLVVIVACVVLQFVPIKFIYPSRTTFYYRINQGIVYAWAASALACVWMYPDIPSWLISFNLAIVGLYVVMSLLATLRRPRLTERKIKSL
jgi:phosphatidylcholine synthase